MFKYIRLLRLQDQYTQIGCALGASIFLHIKGWWLMYWILGVTFGSYVAFMLNELTDREDTDKFSWNPVHLSHKDKFDPKIIAALFGIFTLLTLSFSYLSGFFWWGMVSLIIGVIYSLKPIRLKGRFGLDLIGQLLVWFIIPFLAPVAKYSNILSALPFLPLVACFGPKSCLISWQIIRQI